jgi:hypothetical protein
MAPGAIYGNESRRLMSKFLDYRPFIQQSKAVDMKSRKLNPAAVPKIKKAPVLPLKAMLLGLLILNCMAHAQQEVTPPPTSASPQPAWQQAQANEFEVFNPKGLIPGSGEDQPFQWGPVTARPHVFYQLLYGNGIQSSPSNQQDTVIQEISPGILFDIGNHWSLDYTPTLRYYSDSHFQNEFDNAVTLSGATAYEDWRFGLSQSYTGSSSPQAQTGTQTDQEEYLTALSASYAFNSEMSLDMSVNQDLSYVANAFAVGGSANNSENTKQWSTVEWLNYEFWPRLNAGIGAGFGYVNVNISPDQTYEQLQGRVNWRATDKISFQISGGLEDRQIRTAGAGDLLNPTFGVAIQYQPFEQTEISLNADRTVSSSDLYALAQVTETTSFSINVNQRLLEKFYLTVGGGYSTIKYTSSLGTVFGTFSGNRTDDYYSFNARLSRAVLKRGTVALTYQYSKDSSSQPGFSYGSNQIGFEVGYSY